MVVVTGMNSRINMDDRRWHDLSACFRTTGHVRTRACANTWLNFVALNWLYRLAATKHAIPRCNAVLFIPVHIRRNEHLFTSKPGSFRQSGPDQRKWGQVQRSAEVGNWEVIHTNLCAQNSKSHTVCHFSAFLLFKIWASKPFTAKSHIR